MFSVVRLVIVILLCSQTSWFQTWLAGVVANYLSDEWQNEVVIDLVDIDFFDAVNIEGLFVSDQQQDTLLYAPLVRAEVGELSLEKKRLFISQVLLDEPRVRVVTYQGDTAMNFQFIADYFKSEDTTTTESEWQIGCDLVELRRSVISLQNKNVDTTYYGLNFHDIGFRPLTIQLTDFRMDEDTMRIDLAHLDAEDKSGFQIDSLHGSFAFSPAGLRLEDFKLLTPHSNVGFSLDLETEGYEAYGEYVAAVRHNLRFEDTKVSAADIAYFVPMLEGLEREVLIHTGRVSGFVNQLSVSNLHLEMDDNTFFKGSLSSVGLPDIHETFFTIGIERMETNYRELSRIQLPPFTESHYLDVPAELSQMGQIKVKGNFDGTIDDFVAQAKLKSDVGLIKSDIHVMEDTVHGYRYNGRLAAESFNLGRLLDEADLGSLTAHLNLERAWGTNLDNLDAIGTAEVTFADYKGYHYTDIALEGEVSRRFFEGKVESHDPNLDFLFDGQVDFSKRTPEMEFEADLRTVNLAKLNLLDRDTSSHLEGKLAFHIKGIDPDLMDGTVTVDTLVYAENGKAYPLGPAVLEAVGGDSCKSLYFNSALVEARIEGLYNFDKLEESMRVIVSTIVPAFFDHEELVGDDTQEFDFRVDVKDFTPVQELFIPELSIAPGTAVWGEYLAGSSRFKVEAQSDAIVYDKRPVNGFTLDIDKSSQFLTLEAGAKALGVTEDLNLDNFNITGAIYQDNFPLTISWADSLDERTGRIQGDLSVYSPQKYEFEFFPSNFKFQLGEWDLGSGAAVFIDSTAIEVDALEVSRGNQNITINGKLSTDTADRMYLDFNQFEIGNFNGLLESQGLAFGGTLEGTGYVSDPYKNLFFEADYTVDEMTINDLLAGDMKLNSIYDQDKKVITIDGGLTKEELKQIVFNGLYHPADKESPLDLTVNFDKTDLRLVNAFMPPESARLRGAVDGKLTVTGLANSPQIEGDLDFLKAGAFVAYTNCNYGFGGKVKVYPDMIAMDYIPVTDVRGKKGFMAGTILHNNFEDMNFDLAFYVKNFQCLNTTERMNDLYYGTAYATADVFISGDLDNLEVEVEAKSEKGSQLNLPLSGSTEVTEQDFVTYYGVNDPPRDEEDDLDLSGITMRFKMEVTEDAMLQLIFDEKVGDLMWGRGKGILNMEITPSGEFKMTGGLEVSQGEYTFTLQNAINKTFVVRNGGTIKWFGDPYSGDMNLTAAYSLRTPLYDLMSNQDNAESFKTRTEVNLLMHLTQSILSPNLRFEVELPSTDEATKGHIASLLNSDEELNKQAFSLLMLKKFLPPSGGASTSGGIVNDVSTSSTEVLATQLGNWVSQISKDFDIGFDYRPGDDLNGSEIAVALSTQFLNDRLTVSGNFGVQSGTEEANNLLGDFQLEYRLDEEGQVKMRAFNKSNQNDLTAVDQSRFTQGVGILYRTQFDSLTEVYTLAVFDTLPDVKLMTGFSNIFRKKNHPKRRARALHRQQKAEEREKERLEKEEKEKAIRERYEKLLKEEKLN